LRIFGSPHIFLCVDPDSSIRIDQAFVGWPAILVRSVFFGLLLALG